MTSVLMAESRVLFGDCLARVLEGHGFRVVARAGNEREVLDKARSLEPDMALLSSGVEDAEPSLLVRQLAEAAPRTRAVVLFERCGEGHLRRALEAGAWGVLVGDVGGERLCELLSRVGRDEPVLAPSLARRWFGCGGPEPRGSRGGHHPDELTPREGDVLRALSAGHTSNRQLADHLGVSVNTAKFHVRNILDKLALTDRTQAVAHAFRRGLVP
jgi:two-component system, NarL family, response regulator LiaR